MHRKNGLDTSRPVCSVTMLSPSAKKHDLLLCGQQLGEKVQQDCLDCSLDFELSSRDVRCWQLVVPENRDGRPSDLYAQDMFEGEQGIIDCIKHIFETCFYSRKLTLSLQVRAIKNRCGVNHVGHQAPHDIRISHDTPFE